MSTTAQPASRDTQITSSSATELAAAIRERRLSSAEIVEAHLRRIEEVNPRLNAVVQLRAEAAREEARAADAALDRGEALGSLHGVPITVKDVFDVTGMVCTGGTQGRASYVSPADATAVARLRAAGAIVLGMTNTPELTLAFETDNLVYGRTNNPYALDRTPGGSSGGEAAMIASGGSPLGIGTDIAGSIRVPAHFCGIAGLKPTLGRVPLTGVFPPTVGLVGGMYHAGPLARRVEDLGLLLSVISGPDWHDPRATVAPYLPGEKVDVRGLRLASFADNGVIPPTPETAATVEASAATLRAAGANVREARPAGVEQSLDLFVSLMAADGGAAVQMLLGMAGTTQPHELLLSLGAMLQPAAAASAADFGGLLARWDVYRMTMQAFFAEYDAIVCPVNARPAPLHGTTWQEEILAGFSYTMAYSLTGWPCVVVRAGTSPEGLPIGVQVIARPWREDVALAIASEIEAASGGWQSPTI